MAEDRSSAVPQGLVVPMLTPFEADGSIASDLFIAHAKHLLAQGAAGLAPFGTTGEALSVGINARISSIDRLLDHGISPDFLIPGTGLTSLDDTANLSRAMLDRSVRAVMVLPPFYYKNVSNQGIITYFTRLIERLGEDARIVLYHIPKVAMVGFGVDVVQHLKARFPDQILAIKDSSGDWSNMQALMGIDGLHVYPGSERNLPEALAQNAPGCISASANINAKAIADTIKAVRQGQHQQAKTYHAANCRLRSILEQFAMIPFQKQLFATITGDQRWCHLLPPLEALDETRFLEGRALLAHEFPHLPPDPIGDLIAFPKLDRAQ